MSDISNSGKLMHYALEIGLPDIHIVVDFHFNSVDLTYYITVLRMQ